MLSTSKAIFDSPLDQFILGGTNYSDRAMKSPTIPAILLGLLLSIPAQALETVTVSQSEIPRHFRLDGVVEAVNQSTIASQTSAQITEVLFDVDDYVEKGAVIVVMRSGVQKAGVEQASANLRAARARLTEAEAEHKRIKDVFDRQLVSRQEMDRAAAALKTARAGFEAAQAAVNQAGQQLEYTRVTAPYGGIVTAASVPGEGSILTVSLRDAAQMSGAST